MAYQQNYPVYAAELAGLDWWNRHAADGTPLTAPAAPAGQTLTGTPPPTPEWDKGSAAGRGRPDAEANLLPGSGAQPHQESSTSAEAAPASPFANWSKLDPNSMEGRAGILKGLQTLYAQGAKLGKSQAEILAAGAELGSQFPNGGLPANDKMTAIERGTTNGVVNMWDWNQAGGGSNSS
jgi:hypothetical protein